MATKTKTAEIDTAQQERFFDRNEYKKIYNISDMFEREQALERFAAEGKKAGVIGVKKIYAQFVKENRGGKLYASNVTAFDGQPIELVCGEWTADDTGVTKEGAFGEEVVACVHPILPVTRLINVDTGIEKLEIAFRRGRAWQRTIVSKSTIASANRIVELADSGIAVTSESARHLVTYLHDVESANYDEIPKAKSVTRMGYIGGEFIPYTDGVVFDGDASYRHLFDAISQKGSLDEWKRCITDLRQHSTAAKIVIAAAFASVLIEPLGCLPFFVHLWGSASGTGKTVGLMAAASVWGDPSIGKYIQTFHSTTVGHERLAAFLNNLPVIIDELQLSDVDRDGNKNFNVYRLAEGVGKSRGNRRGGMDATPTWSNAIITSGETPILSDGAAAGARNRVIEVECTNGAKVVQDGHSVAATVQQNFGIAGKLFMQRLDLDRARELYQEQYALFVDRATEKQAMAAACLTTADILATEYILDDGLTLTADELSVYLQTSAEVDANERAFSFLRDWVARNAAAFSPGTAGSRECFGVLDTPNPEDEIERVYIIKTVFRDAITRAGYSYKSFQAWLAANGLLRTHGKTYTVVKHINGLRTDCYDVRLRKFDPVPFGEQTELPF